MSVSRDEIVKFLNEKLAVKDIPDSSSNGLQVEGAEEITKVGLAVDACLPVYEKAVSNGCQMVIVHHGLIWDGIKYVTGGAYKHLKYLIENDLNLYASHLPLDVHNELGNNAIIAKLLGVKKLQPFGDYKGNNIGFEGELSRPLSSEEIAAVLQKEFGGSSVILPFGKKENLTVGVVSGGGSSVLNEAIEKSLDCFITGEGGHWNYHPAKEAGINVIYAGHYHTEKPGVIALGELLKKKFKIESVFLDELPIENHY